MISEYGNGWVGSDLSKFSILIIFFITSDANFVG